MNPSRNAALRLLRILRLGCALWFLSYEALLADGDRAGSGPSIPPPRDLVVRVGTASELQRAVAGLVSNTTILLEPGTYRLSDTLAFPQHLSGVALRGAVSGAGNVVILGAGMSQGIRFGIWMDNVRDVTIADLSIGEFSEHCIILNGGVDRLHLYNVRLFDSGDQLMKANPDGVGGGVDDARIDYCIFEYTTNAPDPYTNGISAHGAGNWIVRNSLFRNIRVPADQGLAGPALLFWRGSRNTVAEGNKFIDCARPIAFGLGGGRADDHSGGVIRNNMIFRSAWVRGDAGIIVESSGRTKVLHNTVILNGTYPNAIEYRFRATTGVEVKYNLTDAAIIARDGARADVAGNVAGAQPTWFARAASGDLHLAPAAVQAIDRAAPHADVSDDYDLQRRPWGPAPDVGADEYTSGGIGAGANRAAARNTSGLQRADLRLPHRYHCHCLAHGIEDLQGVTSLLPRPPRMILDHGRNVAAAKPFLGHVRLQRDAGE